MKYNIVNHNTGEQLAVNLTIDEVEIWWKQDGNSIKFFGLKVIDDTIYVSPYITLS